MAAVTLQHIARHAKVSVASVSKALSGDPEISEATRQRVRKISRQLNYQPRRRQRHASFRLRRVALGVCPIHDSSMDIGSVSGIFASESMRQNVGLELVSIEQDRSEAQTSKLEALFREVDGVLLFGAVQRSTLAWLGQLQIPAVVLGLMSGDSLDPLPYGAQVTSDVQRLGERATRSLIATGHRRVGFYCSEAPEGLYFDQWLQGYHRAHTRAGIAVDPSLISMFGLSERVRIGARAAERVLSMDDPPTGFLLPDPLTAAMFIESMRAAGREPDPKSLIVGGVHADSSAADDLQAYPQIIEDLALITRTAFQVLAEQASGRIYPAGLRMFVPFQVANLPA